MIHHIGQQRVILVLVRVNVKIGIQDVKIRNINNYLFYIYSSKYIYKIDSKYLFTAVVIHIKVSCVRYK
jgi:hypothetical protein